jgi:hypothetical protein
MGVAVGSSACGSMPRAAPISEPPEPLTSSESGSLHVQSQRVVSTSIDVETSIGLTFFRDDLVVHFTSNRRGVSLRLNPDDLETREAADSIYDLVPSSESRPVFVSLASGRSIVCWIDPSTRQAMALLLDARRRSIGIPIALSRANHRVMGALRAGAIDPSHIVAAFVESTYYGFDLVATRLDASFESTDDAEAPEPLSLRPPRRSPVLRA